MALDIDERFAFHPADTPEKQQAHTLVRAVCKEAAEELVALVPECRELSTAITKLQEAMMHANAGIAINGTKLDTGGA